MTPFLNPTYIIAILIAISVHEWAHAYSAYRLGDSTAKYAGRMTVNPIAHLDLLGSLLFLVVGFGWAKPVPIDPRHFRSPRRDGALVALAGPSSNLILAFGAFLGLLLLTPEGMGNSAFDLLVFVEGGSVFRALMLQILGSSLFVNLALMAFNLFPIAPLDGSRILEAFIPLRYELEYAQVMRHGPSILLLLILFESFLPFRPLTGWVYGIIDFTLSIMSTIVALIPY